VQALSASRLFFIRVVLPLQWFATYANPSVTFTPHMSDVLAAYGLFVQNSLGDADAAEALYKVRSMRLGRARSHKRNISIRIL